MRNIIERLSNLNSHLEKTMRDLNLTCKDFDEVKEALKTSKEDLSLTKTKIDELRQGKFCQKDSWISVEHSINEYTLKLEKSCVENSDKIAKEQQWKNDQKAKIDIFIQKKKENLSENYKNQLKSIK